MIYVGGTNTRSSIYRDDCARRTINNTNRISTL